MGTSHQRRWPTGGTGVHVLFRHSGLLSGIRGAQVAVEAVIVGCDQDPWGGMDQPVGNIAGEGSGRNGNARGGFPSRIGYVLGIHMTVPVRVERPVARDGFV